MVVDKEEKYLAFLSHHNKPRCLDGGSPLPTGMESHSRSPRQLGRGPFPALMKCRLHLTPHRGPCRASCGTASSVAQVPGGGTAHDPRPGAGRAQSSADAQGNRLGKAKLQIYRPGRSLVQPGAPVRVPAYWEHLGQHSPVREKSSGKAGAMGSRNGKQLPLDQSWWEQLGSA